MNSKKKPTPKFTNLEDPKGIHSVRLTHEDKVTARKLGDGKVSKGVRYALKKARELGFTTSKGEVNA